LLGAGIFWSTTEYQRPLYQSIDESKIRLDNLEAVLAKKNSSIDTLTSSINALVQGQTQLAQALTERTATMTQMGQILTTLASPKSSVSTPSSTSNGSNGSAPMFNR
jgi:TolA-binding protein